ncbi:hypothetical protein AB3R30_18890 [Leptolyngbyaceae cyanobacterium UHCC 1019]
MNKLVDFDENITPIFTDEEGRILYRVGHFQDSGEIACFIADDPVESLPESATLLTIYSLKSMSPYSQWRRYEQPTNQN